MQRTAPNNALPATHFYEVWTDGTGTNQNDIKNGLYSQDAPAPIHEIKNCLNDTMVLKYRTIAIFRIRENKLPTKHKF